VERFGLLLGELHDLAIHHAYHRCAHELLLLSGGGYPFPFASVRTTRPPTRRDSIPFGYQFLYVQPPVGVGGSGLENAPLVELAVRERGITDLVVDEVLG
jgi:hypothetical protein